MRGFAVPTYAYARNNPLKFTDPTGLDVPEDSDHLIDWAEDLCSRCPGEIKFKLQANGPSRGPIGPDPGDTTNCPANNGGMKSGTITSWECAIGGGGGTMGGSIGVAEGAWTVAAQTAPSCNSGGTPKFKIE